MLWANYILSWTEMG